MTELSREIKHSAQEWAPKFFTAAMIGLVTSVPMALVMSGLDRLLPKPKTAWWQRWWSLPPKRITARFARRSGMNRIIAPGTKWGAPTWLAHLGYGAATASLYPLFSRLLPIPSVLRGMLFAMTVWAGSYLGWLPAVNIMPSASRQPARRNAVMIASHLVWGTLIGLLAKKSRIDRKENDESTT